MSITAIFYVLIFLYCLFKAFASRPIWGLWAYFFAFYLHPHSKYWGSQLPTLRWSLIAAIVTLLVLFVKKKQDEKFVFFEFVENKIFFLFVIFVAIQYFWALSGTVHMVYVVMTAKFLLLIFLIQNCLKTNKDILLFILINLVGSAYVSYIGISQHSGGRFEGVGGPGLSETNEIAQHLGVVLIMSAYLLLCRLGKKSYLLIIPILLLLQAIMMTESRGAMIALAGAAFFSLIYSPKKVRKQFILFAVLGGIAFSALVGPQLLSRFDKMSSNDDGELKGQSANSRFVMMDIQWGIFKEQPILGHGHKGTLILSPIYVPEKYLTREGVRASHNLVMSMLVDHGAIGSILYFSVTLCCLLKARAACKTAGDEDDIHLLRTLLLGIGISLIYLMLGGLGSNNKVMEVDIWLYALIPLLFSRLKNIKTIESINEKS